MSVDPFCNKEETNRTRVYESDKFMIIYDIMPIVEGHILVVPKRHVLDMIDLSDEEVKDLHVVFQHAVPKILDIYSKEHRSYNLSSQIGPYSGRTVPHLHFHILPRRKDDKYNKRGGGLIFDDLAMNKSAFTLDDVDMEVKKLRKVFKYTP